MRRPYEKSPYTVRDDDDKTLRTHTHTHDPTRAARLDVVASRGRACSRAIVRRAAYGPRTCSSDGGGDARNEYATRVCKPGRESTRHATTTTGRMHYCKLRRPQCTVTAVDATPQWTDGTYTRGGDGRPSKTKTKTKKNTPGECRRTRHSGEKTSSSGTGAHSRPGGGSIFTFFKPIGHPNLNRVTRRTVLETSCDGIVFIIDFDA